MRDVREVHLDGYGTTNEHITEIKYSTTVAGALVRQSRDDVIRQISFVGEAYRSHNDRTGEEAPIKVVAPAGRARYIATVADGRVTNNLLNLPRF